MNQFEIPPNCKIYRKSFNSLEDFARQAMFGKSCLERHKRHSIRHGNSVWYGSTTLEESYDWAVNGWSEGEKLYEKYKHYVPSNLLESLLPCESFETRWEHDVTGSMIDMSIAARNIGPLQFITERDDDLGVRRGRNMQRIVINGGGHCNIDAQMFLIRGILTYSLIEHLEKIGYAVELIWEETTSSTPIANIKNASLCTIPVTIKRFGEISNFNRLMFALSNVSMFRRLAFAVEETLPENIVKMFGFHAGSHYGYPIGVATRQKPNTLVLDVFNTNSVETTIKIFSDEVKKHYLINNIVMDEESKEVK